VRVVLNIRKAATKLAPAGRRCRKSLNWKRRRKNCIWIIIERSVLPSSGSAMRYALDGSTGDICKHKNKASDSSIRRLVICRLSLGSINLFRYGYMQDKLETPWERADF
jgi:hypothetical protein